MAGSMDSCSLRCDFVIRNEVSCHVRRHAGRRNCTGKVCSLRGWTNQTHSSLPVFPSHRTTRRKSFKLLMTLSVSRKSDENEDRTKCEMANRDGKQIDEYDRVIMESGIIERLH